MNIRMLIGICFCCLSGLGGVFGNLTIHRMIDEINRKSASDPTVSHSGFLSMKFTRIVTDYENLYPLGKLRSDLRASIAALLIGFVGTVLCLMVRFR
jgi:hypothetical protein